MDSLSEEDRIAIALQNEREFVTLLQQQIDQLPLWHEFVEGVQIAWYKRAQQLVHRVIHNSGFIQMKPPFDDCFVPGQWEGGGCGWSDILQLLT